MPSPIRELAKLTCQAKNIEGSGSGSGLVDKMEVAAILGMKNPATDKKLYRESYNLARFLYCDDKNKRLNVKVSLLKMLLHEDTGKLKEDVILRLVLASMRELVRPATIIDKDGKQEIVSYSKTLIAKQLDIKKQSITDRHTNLYEKCVEQLNIWSSDALQHIKSHYEDMAE